ncbi:MAG: hypothetical protein QOH29_2060 [Actinomycetota bacterium]|nr:hypothetical protein [Actinomycetota bacterium]
MSKSRGSARRGRSVFIIAALAITCGAVFLGSAGTASAGNLITCGGKVAATGKNANTDAKYFVVCSEDIRGFSVISTAKFDFFGSETDVTPTLSQSATLQCEGSVPGYGFGCGVVNRNTPANCGTTPSQPKCASRLSAGNTISGAVSFDKSPCLTSKPKLFVTAASEPFVTSVSTAVPPGPDTSTMGAYDSQPFRLKLTGFTGKKCAKTVKADSKGKK